MKGFIYLASGVFLSSLASANTVINVGTGLVPDYDPAQGTTWELSSSCVDINEHGEAACQVRADGPVYSCGWRNAQNCSSKVYHVARWDGVGMTPMSAPDATDDVPLVMNNRGDIAGYAYDGALYPSGGGNGRIWSTPEYPQYKSTIVTSLNDDGEYILRSGAVSGGITTYDSTAHEADGTSIPFPGTEVRPFVIGNNGEVIGGQVIQDFVQDIFSPTGNEIPEVSGVGWLLAQSDVDGLPLNETGLYDIDGDMLWQATYYRPTTFSNYATTVSDVNDYGDFVLRYQFGGLFQGRYCTREGESIITDVFGISRQVPWICDSTDYNGGTYAGGKAFRGINNIGDAVGSFTPGAYSYQTEYMTYPWAWLRNAAGGWDEYDVNDLLPVGSGYTVLTVQDINDNRQIVGTCVTDLDEVRGCIIDVAEPAIPGDVVKPKIRIDSPTATELSGIVTIHASAWDRGSRIKKVIFKIGNTAIGQDASSPYTMEWDTTVFSPGPYSIKVIALDNAGNRRSAKLNVVVTSVTAPPTPAPGGEAVEGEGTITALGDGYVEIKGVAVYYNEDTVIKLNEVSDFSTGLPAQYKGIRDGSGAIIASDLEVN